MSTQAPIELRRGGPVAELVLTRPEVRNAMNVPMGEAVREAVRELNADPEVRVVLVRGEGKSFSAGGDLGMLDERAREAPEANRRFMLAFYDLFLAVRALHAPSIAVLHGAAIGAGACFALGCDLRVAAAGAKLGFTFVRVGLHPGMGASWLLPRLVGPARAAELLLTGDVIPAEEAARIGLVNRVVPPERLEEEVGALAGRIASAAPLAVQRTKASLRAVAGLSLEQALEREASAQALDYAGEDLPEAVAAFRERREPRFRGR